MPQLSNAISPETRLLPSRFNTARRSLFLVTAFDVTFVGFMWLIYCITKGYSLKEAFEKEVENFSISVSLFDIVVVSIMRFIVVNVCYVLIRMNHWLIIAIVTFGASGYLIAKVVIFSVKGTHKVITDYILLIISFLITWFLAWYLDQKILIKSIDDEPVVVENKSDNTSRKNYGSVRTRNFASEIGSFYSPMGSIMIEQDNEDLDAINEVEAQSGSNTNYSSPVNSEPDSNQTFERLGDEVIAEMQAICQTQDGWKLEKRREESVDIPANIQVPSEKYETVIYSRRFDKIGKVFKLESYLGFNIDLLLDVLRVKVESYPEWNTAVKDAKILRRISDSLAIIYVTSHEQASGIIKAREFINLSKHAKVGETHILGGKACEYEAKPPDPSMIRGENGPTGYFITPINDNLCKITWILNVDLKGWIPTYVIDQTMSSVQLDFISTLKKHLRNVQAASNQI